MAITGVQRTALIQLRVTNMQDALRHYNKIVGLDHVGKTADGREMLKGFDEFAHHSVVLRETDKAGMDFICFKAQDDAFMDEVAARAKAFGTEYSWIEANTDQPGFGRRLSMITPMGHNVQLVADIEMAADHPEIKNPNIWQKEPHGMGVSIFDHALLYGPNVKEGARFYSEVLGMHMSETVYTPDGEGNLACFFTCANTPHDVAILEFPEPGKLHHVGFALESWNDLGHAADLISINEVRLDEGPFRHGITRGMTIYFFDPSGNRNEVYAGGYRYFPEQPLRYWDFEKVERGVSYYKRVMPEGWLDVVT